MFSLNHSIFQGTPLMLLNKVKFQFPYTVWTKV